MLTHHSFHSGKIQSIGVEIDGRSVRAGFIAIGAYRFQIERSERMTVLRGELQVRCGSELHFKHCLVGGSFFVSAHTEFEIVAEVPTVYLCELF